MQSENIPFTLNLENLKDIPFQKYQNDFTFIVDGKRYQTNRFVADLLSPYLRNCHFLDSSINEFTINTNIAKEEQNIDYFDNFLNLASFNNFQINGKQQQYFSTYFYLLGNIEEYYRILPQINQECSVENAIDILTSMSQISPVIPDNILSFLASHFEEIDKKKLKKVDVKILEQIFQNKSFQISDEDSLLNFLLSLYEDGHSYSVLFEHVQFINLSENSLKKFIELFDFESMNKPIWKSISERLLSSKIESKSSNTKNGQNQSFGQTNESKKEMKQIVENKFNDHFTKPQNDVKEFNHQEGKEFDGIMRYLTRETGGNIHDNGTIKITSNSINSDNDANHPKNLVDYDKDNLYCSKDAGNATICFDFKNRLVKLESYSIMSYNCGKNWSHLKNWIIEVSNDGESWAEIDNHENDPSLNGEGITATFYIQENTDFNRYIRLRQTGTSWNKHSSNHTLIVFPFIDFYGKIKKSE